MSTNATVLIVLVSFGLFLDDSMVILSDHQGVASSRGAEFIGAWTTTATGILLSQQQSLGGRRHDR